MGGSAASQTSVSASRDLAPKGLVALAEEVLCGVVIRHGLGGKHRERLDDSGALLVEFGGGDEVPEKT